MYTRKNFKTKKALKEAVAQGETVTCFSPGPFPCPTDGKGSLEGPHYPQPHSWHAQGVLKDGVLVSVR